jgi:hypothetical protein
VEFQEMIGFTPVAKKMLRLAEQFILFWCCLEKDASFEGTTNLYRPSFLIYLFFFFPQENKFTWVANGF